MKKNKKGTSTLFLAIILSALILVETTYIAFVADLDRRLTYTRALKEQAQIYLASYDRQLFKTYGIYAFNSSYINSSVFDQIVTANGYEPGDVIYASGMYSIDTEDLKRAVACYYAYRTSGIMVDRFSEIIVSFIDQIGDGIISELRQFISSPSSGLLRAIIEGGAGVSEAISGALELLGIDESSPSYQLLMNLFSSLGAIDNDSPDISNGFDPADMEFLFGILEFNTGLYDYGTEFNETINIHSCLADYAANNFDCTLEDDTAIDGTSFSVFHTDNESDSEYILTGLEGLPGRALTDYYILGALFLKNLVCNMTDAELQEIITPTAEILSVIIGVLSSGAVILPPEVYEAVILSLITEIQSVSELWQVLHGEEVTFVSIGEMDILNLDYRDFLTVFMCFVPDDLLTERMLVILDRDFPDYVTGIDVETDYGGSTLSYETRYELYE